jgi:hypothetical protein
MTENQISACIGAGMLVVVVFAAFAWTGAYISTQKCRPPQEGVLFGLFLGPLGLIIAACMPTLLPPVAEKEEPELDVSDLAERLRSASLDEWFGGSSPPRAPREPMIAPPKEGRRGLT